MRNTWQGDGLLYYLSTLFTCQYTQGPGSRRENWVFASGKFNEMKRNEMVTLGQGSVGIASPQLELDELERWAGI